MSHILLNQQPDLNPSMMHCKKCGQLGEPSVRFFGDLHPLFDEGKKYYQEHLDISCRRCDFTVAIRTSQDTLLAEVRP